MVANFVHRPLAMIGLIVFLAIFVFVMVGPHIWVLDLSEQDSTLTNLPPSQQHDGSAEGAAGTTA